MNSNKKISYLWTVDLGIKFLDVRGFPSEKFYNEVLISKMDFLNYAAGCEIERPATQTRRESSKLKKFLSFGIK